MGCAEFWCERRSKLRKGPIELVRGSHLTFLSCGIDDLLEAVNFCRIFLGTPAVDSFFNKLERLSSKLNDKLDKHIEAVEENVLIRLEKNKVLNEQLRLIDEDLIAQQKRLRAEEELLKKFNDYGISTATKEEVFSTTQEELGSTTQDSFIQGYLPKIASIFGNKLGPAVMVAFSDPDRLSDLARNVYQVLPVPIRLVVKEQSFVKWTISHQDTIVETIKSQVALTGSSNYVPDPILAPAVREPQGVDPGPEAN